MLPVVVTPGITATEYSRRRSKLAAQLPNDALAVIAASDIKYRSGAVFYEFHQDSNFFYLTGFNEPQALAVIGKSKDDGDHVFHLYVRPKDPKAEQWDGARSGTQAATDVFNADETGDINRIQTLLPEVLSSASSIYTNAPMNPGSASFFSRFFSNSSAKEDSLNTIFKKKNLHLHSLQPLINPIRALKSPAEISNMRLVGQASGCAFTESMRHAWTREKDLTSFLEYRFKAGGCDTSAYVPVVAGGVNALSIHYVRNDDVLRDGELVLTDAGGEYAGYITDITRTFPISGQFTPPQAELYAAVLAVQRTCVALCRSNANVSLDKLHEIAENALRDELRQLGFDMSGNALEVLFPHHISHYIGLDVHDTPGYSRKETLKEGHCVTVEPGIYVPNDERWPRHFRGLGIRIEDSIAVQEEHPLVLTTEAVKEIVDIEALRA
ncbi:hypothetical protein MMC20_000817 [Loxospora ochrophaea]|nr:hypothetical protein [Loxospora ochrophaea]